MPTINFHKRHFSLINEKKIKELNPDIANLQPINKRFKIEIEKIVDGNELLEEILILKDKINKIKEVDGSTPKYEFSEDQNEFLNEFIKASFTKIFKPDELLRNLEKLQERFNFSILYQFILLTAPRKVGKTFIIAVYMVILLCLFPNAKISIFSPGQNSSGRILEEAKPILDDLGIEIIQTTAKKSVTVRNKWDGYGKALAHPNNTKIGVYSFLFFFLLFFIYFFFLFSSFIMNSLHSPDFYIHSP